jgi:hypothetical protein
MQMNAPSRNMPAAPVHKASPWAWLFLAVMISGLAYWFSRQPYLVGVLVAVLGGLVWIQAIWNRRRLCRLAASRQGESICEFARSFDRQTDTWLIRSVYEEISRYISIDGLPISVRHQDCCEKDLGIDPEDLDDIARDAAFRARRSMDGCDKNPFYGKVRTVGDIVRFLQGQPRIVEPGAAPNGGPVTQFGNSSVTEGPPSVS